MKLLFISQYFYPESFKGNDIVFDFVKRGHDVTVLTAKPNYPRGKFYDGYSFFGKKEEYIQGAKIIRTPIFPRRNGKGIYLLINYLSFVFFSYFTCIFRIRDKYDAIFVQQLSPVTMALPGLWIKKRQNTPICVWVLDLWPESVSSASSFNNLILLSFLDRLVKKIYNKADMILISSEFFRKSISGKIKNKYKPIIYFPNWAEETYTNQIPLNLDTDLPSLPSGTKIMFAGNVGEAQDFESVLKAAEITKHANANIYWIIVGDGRKIDWLKNEIVRRHLKNVILLGRFPLETLPSLFKEADVMLVSLKDTPTLALTVPAKIQAYMASSKIILGMINGEANELINKAQCGFSVNAGRYEDLAEKALCLSKISKEEKDKFEQNARTYYENNFEKEKLLTDLERDLMNMIYADKNGHSNLKR
jgi:glycosyltransferase involved in cell wall biosynthesis